MSEWECEWFGMKNQRRAVSMTCLPRCTDGTGAVKINIVLNLWAIKPQGGLNNLLKYTEIMIWPGVISKLYKLQGFGKSKMFHNILL